MTQRASLGQPKKTVALIKGDTPGKPRSLSDVFTGDESDDSDPEETLKKLLAEDEEEGGD
jgi:hypothetical protein